MSDSSTRSRHHAAATQRWSERFERFATSKHSVVAFCAAEGVSESNFYLWRRRLAPSASSSAPAPTVVPIHITPAPAAPIELALPSGVVLRFPTDTRPELLVAILRGLEERPC